MPDRPDAAAPRGDGPREPGRPRGSTYEWLQRGLALLADGEAAAAATLLTRAHAQEPASTGILEALARAQYDAGDIAAAAESFRRLAHARPADDYAHFGLGLSLSRLGRFGLAAEHLAMAHVMRPDRPEYADRLRQVRATLAARQNPGSP
ncbi:tetratricopeptide repeat protein [Paenibacillus sp. TRM 82003]|uniref:tetratricopeptide repeat protein n=1 Tax=Kineococcus sp. TRM81007 TaxID=2925831 RepID=UPI001F58CC57|nr:tetratricopeptide repeat protein [Kineococcus sp. TRM81007]MCI2240741.1 tetratricopeptide repeat protein [Kineococcus sp. TRM81007]MCI3925335.1 tetratricopeptide repeat protein [Paenibacillus sp. TRM 82003]